MPQRRVVLVVDDEAITREVVGAMLELEHIDVHTAHDGEQALTMAAWVNPDVVLLDIMMPGVDGFAVCRALQEQFGENAPRIVMLTARADDAARAEAAAAGAAAYLVKPFSARDLFAAVEDGANGA